ncbi:MAG: Hpt domain-containing protein, partial [Pseudobdellovibrionaceae bacterium]|nr:Hpt domain-containing protein [Pseudobdellovibrionaceae bacterium]
MQDFASKVSASIIEQVLVTLRDVADWRNLQEANKEREQELNLLLELVPIPEGRWRDFVKHSHQLLDKAAGEDAGLAPNLAVHASAIALHTLKGMARSVGCRHLSTAVHGVEDQIRSLSQDRAATQSKLTSALAELRQLLSRYEALWTKKLKRGLNHQEPGDNQTALLDELAYRRQKLNGTSMPQPLPELLKTLDAYIQHSLYVSLSSLLRELTDSMVSLATELNKIPPEARFEGQDQGGHRRTANVLRMSLVHLIRNVLDHGLESPAERQDQGKNPRGVIIWDVRAQADRIVITCRDDGRGLDIESLLKKAIDLGYTP